MHIPAMIGLHIGQGQNPTAMAEVSFNGYSYNIINLTRFPANIPYPEVEDFLIKRSKLLRMDGDYQVKIRVNATRIGSPVINFFKQNIPDLMGVYLIGGYKADKKEDDLMLPKELMISHLKVLFQINRIHGLFEKPEPHMTAPEKQRFELLKSLKNELLNYETKVHVDVTHWNPEDKTGEHDDLAIALGLACWPLE